MTKPHNAKLTLSARAEIDGDLAYAAALREKLKDYTCAAIAYPHGVSEEAIKQYKQGRTYNK